MKLKILLLIVIISFDSKSKIFSKDDSLYFFTSNLLFVPTKTSIFESRVGITKFVGKKNLKLDIGVSMDLIGLKSTKNTFSFGADFFTFSNLRSESNFKFPVDAIDYMFGFNFNFKKTLNEKNNLSARLRCSHISSHFEDGHIYERSDTIFKPVVFSKEFIDLALMVENNFYKNLYLKSLLAVNFIFHSIPKSISKLSGQLGLEIKTNITEILNFYVSNDITLASVNSKSNLNEHFETGFEIGKRNSRTVNIYFNYYDGQDYRGQYYGKYLNYKGLGMRLKF